MGRMKDRVLDVIEMFEEGFDSLDIANKFNMPHTEVLRILDLYTVGLPDEGADA